MSRKRNRKRREKRRERNQTRRERLMSLPTGGGPFAGRSRIAFQCRKGDAVNELLEFEFDGRFPLPVSEELLLKPPEGYASMEDFMISQYLKERGELN